MSTRGVQRCERPWGRGERGMRDRRGPATPVPVLVLVLVVPVLVLPALARPPVVVPPVLVLEVTSWVMAATLARAIVGLFAPV